MVTRLWLLMWRGSVLLLTQPQTRIHVLPFFSLIRCHWSRGADCYHGNTGLMRLIWEQSSDWSNTVVWSMDASFFSVPLQLDNVFMQKTFFKGQTDASSKICWVFSSCGCVWCQSGSFVGCTALQSCNCKSPQKASVLQVLMEQRLGNCVQLGEGSGRQLFLSICELFYSLNTNIMWPKKRRAALWEHSYWDLKTTAWQRQQ